MATSKASHGKVHVAFNSSSLWPYGRGEVGIGDPFDMFATSEYAPPEMELPLAN